MSISSINIQPSSGNATIHNERIFDVAYALKSDDVNEYHRIASITQTRQAIYEDYKLHHGRKLNTKATPIREAVVNLNEHHTMKDLIKLSEMLESKYKMKVLHIAIHRDEGHIDKDGKEKINYHAHIVFSNYDFDKHITIKRDKQVMRELQTDVAESLQMERGKENSNKQRLDHRQYKRAMQEVEEKTKDLKSELTKVKEENQELKKYDFKEMQKKITQLEELNSSQKRELHQLNSQVKNNKAEFETLQKRIETYKKTFKTIAPEAKSTKEVIEKVDQLQQEITELKTNLIRKDEVITKQNEAVNSSQMLLKVKEKEVNTLKTQINSLEAQKGSNPSIDTNLTIKSDSNQNMAYLIAHKTIEKDFERSFEKKEVINANTFQTESVQVLTPVPEEQSLYSRIKNNFKGMFEYMQKQYFELMQKFQELEKKNKELTNENAELKAKVKTLELESEAPKQIKKDPVLELLREAESKSFSLEDTQKFAKETREQLSQLKNTGPDLIR